MLSDRFKNNAMAAMSLAINSKTADVFVSFSPHTSEINTSVYENGWVPKETPDKRFTVYDGLTFGDTFYELLNYLEKFIEYGDSNVIEPSQEFKRDARIVLAMAMEKETADVFVKFSPHTEQLDVRIYENGWDAEVDVDKVFNVYDQREYGDSFTSVMNYLIDLN